MKLFIEIRKGETVDKLPRSLAFIEHTGVSPVSPDIPAAGFECG
jgi:hypothetical protein